MSVSPFACWSIFSIVRLSAVRLSEHGSSVILPLSYLAFSAEELESQWADLNSASAEKKKKLSEATEALLFNLSMDDIETQIQSIETHLASEDHGTDLPSAGIHYTHYTTYAFNRV